MSTTRKYKVLFAASEVYPFVKTGGLADVASALPLALADLGHEVRIIVPKYGAIDERKFKIHEVVRLKDLNVVIGDKNVEYSLRSSFLTGSKSRIQIYFVDNQELFGNRQSLYVDPITGSDYPDNDERFILYCRSIFDLMEKLGWIPDVLHINDWQCGLMPAYLKTLYKDNNLFNNIKTILTVHNLAYQGQFSKSVFYKTGLPEELNSEKGIEIYDKINFMKSGLLYSDAIATVSETYSKEICKDEEQGAGLKNILCKRKKDLYGIINGIDGEVWNPQTDKFIPKNYSVKNIDLKKENKKALADRFNFEYGENTPIIGMISRLLDAKGYDLVIEAFDELMKLDLQLIILGMGDKKLHKIFQEKQSKHPKKFSCFLGLNDELAHLIEAGADMFLMPSRYEPCGLNQMYSLVYGTVPIVRETGGLADTVIKFNEKEGSGNGFSFVKYEPEEMLKEIKRAIKIYKDKVTWHKLMKNGMKSDFSWETSAKKYLDVYRSLFVKEK